MALSAPQRKQAASICFGFDRELDEQSLITFLNLFSRPSLLKTLAPRLSDQEISRIVDHLSQIMRSHLSEEEYHTLFLGDSDGGHHHP